MSAHADRDGLLKWVGAFEKKPQKVFVVHGEEDVCDIFTQKLMSDGFSAYAPKFTSSYDLLADQFIYEGLEMEQSSEKGSVQHESPVYQRLISAGARLLDVITHNYGGANKELAAFADEIDKLAGKWDR